MRELGEEYYDARRGVELRLRRDARPRTARRCSASSTSPRPTFVEANPSYEEMEGIVAGVPRLAQYDVDIDAGADASRSRERRLVQPRAAERRDAEAAGQPLLRHRDVAVRDQPRLPREGRQGRRRRRRPGRASARACPTRTSTLAATEEFESQAQSLDADAQEFEPTAVRRLHGDHGDDPDDERVLRGVEELALHRRRERDRARLRRRLAALGHRRHPRGAGPHLRPGRAADRGREPAAGRADRSRSWPTCWPTSRTCATRRPTARSSPPRRPTRSAPRHSARPRRSPAR